MPVDEASFAFLGMAAGFLCRTEPAGEDILRCVKADLHWKES